MNGGKFLAFTKIKNFNNELVIVAAYEFGRKGSMSPKEIYYRYNNAWILPIHFRKGMFKEISANLFQLYMKLYYDPGDFIYQENPFLKLMPPSCDMGTYIAVKILEGD